MAAFALPLVAVLVIIPLSLWARTASSDLAQPGCGESQKGTAGLLGEARITIKPNIEDTSELKFGRSRSPRVLDFRPELFGEAPPAGTPVGTEVRPFRRDDGATLALGQVVVIHSQVSNNGQLLELQVCVDPLYPEPADAGLYKGSVLIDDSGFDSAEFPMSVVLQQVPPTLPFFIVLAGVLIGAATQRFLLWIGAGERPKGAGGGSFLQTHPVGVELVAGLAVALVAAIPVYISQYESNAAWAARPSEMFALAASAFSAAAAGYASTAALVRKPLIPSQSGLREPAQASTSQ